MFVLGEFLPNAVFGELADFLVGGAPCRQALPSASTPEARHASAAFSARVWAAWNASLIRTVARFALTAIELPPLGELFPEDVLVLKVPVCNQRESSDANLCAERNAAKDIKAKIGFKFSTLIPVFHRCIA